MDVTEIIDNVWKGDSIAPSSVHFLSLQISLPEMDRQTNKKRGHVAGGRLTKAMSNRVLLVSKNYYCELSTKLLILW
jgi:hypothetical protein